MKRERWIELVLWVPTLFLVYVFARQGAAKFSDTSGWARAFRIWHYPDWFRVLIGGFEVSAALLLLTRRTAALGAGIIMTVMLGGMATHVYWGRPSQVTSEVFPLLLALLVFWGRRRHLTTFLRSWRRSDDR